MKRALLLSSFVILVSSFFPGCQSTGGNATISAGATLNPATEQIDGGDISVTFPLPNSAAPTPAPAK